MIAGAQPNQRIAASQHQACTDQDIDVLVGGTRLLSRWL